MPSPANTNAILLSRAPAQIATITPTAATAAVSVCSHATAAGPHSVIGASPPSPRSRPIRGSLSKYRTGVVGTKHGSSTIAVNTAADPATRYRWPGV